VTTVKQKAVGNYMEIHSKVEVATDRPERDVLLTIAHELRHVYQDHYNTFPGYFHMYLDPVTAKRINCNSKLEKDAQQFSRTVLREFESRCIEK
jgi:Zn-dependent peptidase ImmA (M78 family)